MMRFITLFGLILMFGSTTLFAGDASDYVGYYWNEEKDGIFQLKLIDSNIEGVTVWGKEPKKDIHNPDPALRERSLGGIVFLWGFTYDAKKNRWKDGKVYDPNSGKTYDAKMSLEKGGKILKMRGYVGTALFGKTAKFDRVTAENMPHGLEALLSAQD